MFDRIFDTTDYRCTTVWGANYAVRPFDGGILLQTGTDKAGREQSFSPEDTLDFVKDVLAALGDIMTEAVIKKITGRRVKFLQDRPAARMNDMNATILKHLKSKSSITAVEASALYGCRALPRRIADLKELGYEIRSEFRKAQNKQRYVRYFIEA